jgi:signal transduction histidine kinase/CheY-like chemotaxis protein
MLASPTRSIRGKLLAVIIGTAFSALMVAAAGLMAYDLRAYRQARIDDLSTLADVLAAASGPALAFKDAREAGNNLALLRVRPSIVAGAIYDAGGKLYASYSPEALEQARLPELGQDGHLIQGGRLYLARSILEKGERVGTLQLVARYEATQRLLDFSAIVSAVVLFSLLVAGAISTRLQRTLSKPILDITAAARRVMEHRDFSVRVTKTTEDEIGYLVDTFNSMLDEVGRRSSALEDADRNKDKFLAVLSHELRNPLNPIRNAVAVLRLARSDVSKVEWAGEVIDRQARALARLLDDLLDVARVTQNKIDLRLQVLDLAAILEMAAETARVHFEANRQSFVMTLPAEPLYVRADPTRMAQVVGNLLNNASKYTDQGGEIRLTAARHGATALISVKDSGVGIAREDLAGVFEMFAQVPAHTTRAGGGLGIGLALVRALVEMHGGRVEARSDGPGKGSEFIVSLPTVQQPLVRQEPVFAGAGQAESSTGLKILVADDVPDSVHSLALALQILGHKVRMAADGAQAWETAVKFHPDIAILDIGMPGLNGYEVAEKIRQSPWGKQILLVALTGWGQRDDVNRARAAGFDRHLTKPADFSVVRKLLDEILSERAATDGR